VSPCAWLVVSIAGIGLSDLRRERGCERSAVCRIRPRTIRPSCQPTGCPACWGCWPTPTARTWLSADNHLSLDPRTAQAAQPQQAQVGCHPIVQPSCQSLTAPHRFENCVTFDPVHSHPSQSHPHHKVVERRPVCRPAAASWPHAPDITSQVRQNGIVLIYRQFERSVLVLAAITSSKWPKPSPANRPGWR
jgi:hypothetical protein